MNNYDNMTNILNNEFDYESNKKHYIEKVKYNIIHEELDKALLLVERYKHQVEVQAKIIKNRSI